MSVEAQIHADIEQLRKSAADTQALYREVCATLFFRYGITPTANKLYHYVRKGSMSAPAEALGKFWQELRDKSRIRIEHPDLPEAVKSAAGDLVENLWSQALAAANEGLEVFRAEAKTAVEDAQVGIDTAHRELREARENLNQERKSIQAQTERILVLERELAAERAGKEALVSQLEALRRQQTALEGALTDARRDFSGELEKLRLALQRSEERCEATEKRALVEIDRERTAAAKYQKDAAQARHTQQESEDRRRAEVALLQTEIGECRQKLGAAEGGLQQLRTANQQTTEQLQSLGASLAERDTEKALLLRELELRQSDAVALSADLQKLRALLADKDGNKRQKTNRKLAL